MSQTGHKPLDVLINSRATITEEIKQKAAQALVKLAGEADFWWNLRNLAEANAGGCEELMTQAIQAGMEKGIFYPDKTAAYLTEKYLTAPQGTATN